MAVQLRDTVTDNTIIPVSSGVGYAKPSLELLSCKSCSIKGNCLAEQLTLAQNHSYQVVKNRRAFTKDKHIFRSGDDAKAIYVVSSGSVKSYILMEDGEEQVLNFFLPGEVFGLSALAGNSHMTSSLALETTTVCKLPLSGFQNRILGQGFLNMISDKLSRDQNMMLMLARKDADGRLASFLVDMLKRIEKHGQPMDVIKLSMTRHDIANYLGLAIETVSRALRRFQDSGMLKVSRREVQIFDYNCLLSVAGTQLTY